MSSAATLSLRRAEHVEQPGLEARLELPAQREQRRLPLPVVRDARQPAVVQLVAEVERELEVLVGERVGRTGTRAPIGAGRARARRAASRAGRAGRGGRHVAALPAERRESRRTGRAGSRPPRRRLAIAALAFASAAGCATRRPAGRCLLLRGGVSAAVRRLYARRAGRASPGGGGAAPELRDDRLDLNPRRRELQRLRDRPVGAAGSSRSARRAAVPSVGDLVGAGFGRPRARSAGEGWRGSGRTSTRA